MYTALVLHAESHQAILMHFGHLIPQGWRLFAHHMTVNMGKAEDGPAAHLVGQDAELIVRTLGIGELVFALGVDCDVPSINEKKHITLCVNEALGGKPKHSNQITNWVNLDGEPIILRGKVEVVL